ncbi:olfactory receptor-like protein OLF3 [Camelus ferus]|nr:olfactory receptor-like protein OLF3 [Camelus ferus]
MMEYASSDWDTQVSLFVLSLVTYLVTVLGNFLIVLLIRLDSRLHTPMYFFLTNLSIVDVLCRKHHPSDAGTTITFQLPMCTNKYIDHISCEVLAVVRLACVDTSSNEVAIVVSSIVLLLTPFCLVLLSYIKIITILKIRSTEGREKAFHTCASHLTVVVLCYGMAIFTYVQPSSSPSVLQEKLVSVFYAILIPVLNPLIYSLRNKEVRGAWQKLLGQLSGLTSKLAT